MSHLQRIFDEYLQNIERISSKNRAFNPNVWKSFLNTVVHLDKKSIFSPCKEDFCRHATMISGDLESIEILSQ